MSWQYYEIVLYSCNIAIFLWSPLILCPAGQGNIGEATQRPPPKCWLELQDFPFLSIDFILIDKISRQMGVRLEIRGEVYDTSSHLDRNCRCPCTRVRKSYLPLLNTNKTGSKVVQQFLFINCVITDVWRNKLSSRIGICIRNKILIYI